MWNPLLGAMPIVTSAWMPRTAPFALDDADDRLRAMTLHHVDLSLIPLVSHEPTAFAIDGTLYVHPDTLARVRATGRDLETAPRTSERSA